VNTYMYVFCVHLYRTSMPSAIVLRWNISAHLITMQASTCDTLHICVR